MDPEIFFPESGQSGAAAKRICRTCPVVDECFEWAVANDVRYGVWGGTSESERRRMREADNNETDWAAT